MNYLRTKFTKISTITNSTVQLEQYNSFFLEHFAEALLSKNKYNTTPYIYTINIHSPYAHVSEIQKITTTIQILANSRPFELHMHSRNINPLTYTTDYKQLLLHGWISGVKPNKISAVCNIEYIKNPIKCSETEQYINYLHTVSID